jgi:hypothetical protein
MDKHLDSIENRFFTQQLFRKSFTKASFRKVKSNIPYPLHEDLMMADWQWLSSGVETGEEAPQRQPRPEEGRISRGH